MSRWAIAAAVSAVLVAGVAGSAASAPPTTGPLGTFFFGPKMARAEVIMVYGGQLHDWWIDQGRVIKIGPSSLTLVEHDGTRKVVAVAPNASIMVNRRAALLSAISRGMNALAAHDGNGPATIVAGGPRPATAAPPALGPLGTFFLGAKMARAEVIMLYGGQLHDWWIDQGRVAQVGLSSLTLVERDGTRKVVAVAPDASITLNRKPAYIADIVRGMKVLAARDGNASASVVKAATGQISP